MPKPSTLAAIDVGTNSFHLVVVKLLQQNKFSVITKEKIVVRLGESPSQIKRLSEKAMERGVEAMKLFALIAHQHKASVRAVATSAVREASNGDEFIERVREETGIEVEVISGFEEARLIYLGVLQALQVYNGRVALFDIGGGSTEFLVGESGKMLYANSFKIGAIRMTQRFFPEERVTREQVDKCQLFLRGEIYFAAREIKSRNCTQLIATSGTAQTVAAMALAARGEIVPESLNTITVSRAEIDSIIKLILKAKTHKERKTIPGIDPRRADIIVAGGIVLQTVLEECGFTEFIISSYALREGVVLDTIHKLEGGPREMAHLSDLRYETVMKTGRMYNFDEAHGKHVAELALQIYDALRPLHQLEDDAREHLEAAAMLHDIGYYISHSSHHKHALYLIQNSEFVGFTNDEIAIIANVARYHRKSHPKLRHPAFADLSRMDQQRVTYLAAILRIADGLDRTHRGAIQSVATVFDDTSIQFRMNCNNTYEPTFELWSAERKKLLTEEIFDRNVNFTIVQ